jgi:hypothetical protein
MLLHASVRLFAFAVLAGSGQRSSVSRSFPTLGVLISLNDILLATVMPYLTFVQTPKVHFEMRYNDVVYDNPPYLVHRMCSWMFPRCWCFFFDHV